MIFLKDLSKMHHTHFTEIDQSELGNPLSSEYYLVAVSVFQLTGHFEGCVIFFK